MKQNPSVLGIDLAKRIFPLVGMDDAGHVVLRKRLTRDALMPYIAQLPPAVIGMEACGGAHYWARRFRTHGHTVKLIAPQFVKPYIHPIMSRDTRDALRLNVRRHARVPYDSPSRAGAVARHTPAAASSPAALRTPAPC